MTEHEQSSYLTQVQLNYLVQGLEEMRVQHKQGQSHLQAWDVRRFLTRIFGFARWDAEVTKMELVNEIRGKSKNQQTDVVTVVYRAQVILRVKAPDGSLLATYSEWAAGDAINFPLFKYGDAHDFAMKTAESQALKRCAINLGDQFGLSLYDKGSIMPVVNGSLVGPNPVDTKELEVKTPVQEEEPIDGVSPDEPTEAEVTQERPPVNPLDELKVAIQSLSPEMREALKFQWNLHKLPKIDQLTLEQIKLVEEEIQGMVQHGIAPQQPAQAPIPENQYMN